MFLNFHERTFIPDSSTKHTISASPSRRLKTVLPIGPTAQPKYKTIQNSNFNSPATNSPSPNRPLSRS